jgi:hypothetical protein
MAKAAIFLAIVIGIIWALFISRALRVVIGVLVIAGISWFLIESDKADKQKVADEAAARAKQTKGEAPAHLTPAPSVDSDLPAMSAASSG